MNHFFVKNLSFLELPCWKRVPIDDLGARNFPNPFKTRFWLHMNSSHSCHFANKKPTFHLVLRWWLNSKMIIFCFEVLWFFGCDGPRPLFWWMMNTFFRKKTSFLCRQQKISGVAVEVGLNAHKNLLVYKSCVFVNNLDSKCWALPVA